MTHMLPPPSGNGSQGDPSPLPSPGSPGPLGRFVSSIVGLLLSLVVIGVVVAIAIIAIPAALAIAIVVGVVLFVGLIIYVVKAKLRRAFGSWPGSVRDERKNVRVRMPPREP